MNAAGRRLCAKFDAAARAAAECGNPRARALVEDLRLALSASAARVAGPAAAGGADPAAVAAEFERVVAVEDFAGRLDAIVRACGPGGAACAAYWADELDAPRATASDIEVCDACGTAGCVDAIRSEVRCPHCGSVWDLTGAIFDEAQFYSQECQKAKSGKFNPNRHYDAWILHILALESDDELCRTGNTRSEDDICDAAPAVPAPEKESHIAALLADLRAVIARNNYLLHVHVTPEVVRNMLKEIEPQRTCLNRNVPLIMKMLTGIGPRRPPDEVLLKLRKYFIRVLEVRDELFPRTYNKPGRTNRNNYPYYIFKILDCILPEDSKYRQILFYIYLQSRTTLTKNDREWEKICEVMPDEITYRATDRNLGLKYRPMV